jgi:hypothetical protein
MGDMNADEYVEWIKGQCGWRELLKVGNSAECRAACNRTYELMGYTEEEIHEAAIVPYEEHQRKLIRRCRDDLCKAICQHGPLRGGPPTIAFLPTRDYNAWATRAPNGDEICILDTSLMATLHVVAECLAEATIADESGKVGALSSAVHTIFEACLDFSGLGDEGTKTHLRRTRFQTASNRAWFASYLYEALLVFVLAHELAHNSLGHLDETTEVDLRGIRAKIKVPVYTRSQRQELAADELGFHSFLTYARTLDRDLQPLLTPEVECTPLFFFELLTFVENKLLRPADPSISLPTHPSAVDRRQHLKELWECNASLESRSYYPFVKPVFKMLNDGFDLIIRQDSREVERGQQPT